MYAFVVLDLVAWVGDYASSFNVRHLKGTKAKRWSFFGPVPVSGVG